MKAKSIACAIHDLHWKNHRRSYGPTLHFSYTIRVDLENGQVRAITMPGFSVRKNENDKIPYRIWPQVHTSNSWNTIYCCQITKDDERAILEYLDKAGYLAKVGTNRPDPKTILELEADLSPEMPSNVILG